MSDTIVSHLTCQVIGCAKRADFAVLVTLDWAGRSKLRGEVNVCAKHCEAHERQTGIVLPPTKGAPTKHRVRNQGKVTKPASEGS